MEEKTLYLPTEHNDRIIAFIGSPLGLLAAWLVLINTVTFLTVSYTHLTLPTT